MTIFDQRGSLDKSLCPSAWVCGQSSSNLWHPTSDICPSPWLYKHQQ